MKIPFLLDIVTFIKIRNENPVSSRYRDILSKSNRNRSIYGGLHDMNPFSYGIRVIFDENRWEMTIIHLKMWGVPRFHGISWKKASVCMIMYFYVLGTFVHVSGCFENPWKT